LIKLRGARVAASIEVAMSDKASEIERVRIFSRAFRPEDYTDAEVLWLITGAPEELEFLQGSESNMDLSLIYPVDPTQLPGELAGVEWPPKQ
jgi:hypothetical protein